MRGDYDYTHATLNSQFIAIIVIILALGGLTLGLALLGYII